MGMRTYDTRDAAATRALGEALGRVLPGGVVVLLRGGLGAGKTALAQGIGRGLGVQDPVVSPSFTLVREYVGDPDRPRLVHVDLYRLSGPDEVEDLGLEDYRSPDDLLVIEWPERGGAALADGGLIVDLGITGYDRRRIVLTPCDPATTDVVSVLVVPAGVVES
jgi:tRNA threonylcarbamoyladenosine biosynthesis protein TsaE